MQISDVTVLPPQTETDGTMTRAEAAHVLKHAVITTVEVHLSFYHGFWVAERRRANGSGWTVIARRRNRDVVVACIDRWFDGIPVGTNGMNILAMTEFLPFEES